MFGVKGLACLSVLALFGAGSAIAGPAHPDPMQIRAALEHRFNSGSASASTLASQAAAAKVSALLQFSLHGTGAENANVTDGTCSGETCTASGGDCECLMFTGNLNATQVGNATWTAGITVNTDDCTNTGTAGPDPANPGFCCFGDGVLDATTSGKSPSKLEISFTGPVCEDPNANDDTSVQGGFIVVTTDSTGKFAKSAGTGQINLFVADDSVTTYLTASGILQVTSPF
jgi:hypothetical protein